MTLRCYVGTLVNCNRVGVLCDKLFSYPSEGVRVGGGGHAPAVLARTNMYAPTEAHPTLPTTFCLPLNGRVAAALTGVERNRLDASERIELQAFDAAAQSVDFPDITP